MSLIKFSDFTTNAIKVTQLKNGKFMRNLDAPTIVDTSWN